MKLEQINVRIGRKRKQWVSERDRQKNEYNWHKSQSEREIIRERKREREREMVEAWIKGDRNPRKKERVKEKSRHINRGG
jgi:hypothetical protein